MNLTALNMKTLLTRNIPSFIVENRSFNLWSTDGPKAKLFTNTILFKVIHTKLKIGHITVKPGQVFCPRIKIWFCCSKFEFILCSNFSTLTQKTDFSSQASISTIKFASITEQ